MPETENIVGVAGSSVVLTGSDEQNGSDSLSSVLLRMQGTLQRLMSEVAILKATASTSKETPTYCKFFPFTIYIHFELF
ncbi:unnamed protein product [Acanthoscelides obtectus]|uniref:Uncharacterized protein n=1 Tax=Acanthoscelides obtectus TaxID=200917 RepID=A0A9P0PYE0_ACAOB|nr:unnamed protein product [Acanthoscelides obtectus]CAK1627664.1 hypothetical protein AOBTE_LOCUS4747 [Acanthoscelides obtectus]